MSTTTYQVIATQDGVHYSSFARPARIPKIKSAAWCYRMIGRLEAAGWTIRYGK